MNNRTKKQIEELATTKNNYIDIVLCNNPDPYKLLMNNKNIKAIAGPSGSNLIAQVKIKNSGKKSTQYRQIANKILFCDLEIQEEIRNSISNIFADIFFYKNKNPVLICYNNINMKTVWHHSPNHILSISLIPEKIHLNFRKQLHIEGFKGGNSMYSV
jgi:hypothetical protein